MIEVRRGVTRTVILTRRWAIKLPRVAVFDQGMRGRLWSLTRGVQANLSEAEWSGSPGVCPVRWSLLGGLVNVYPRCEPVTRELSDADYEAIGCLGPTDRKPGNVGVLDGRMVFVDYDMSCGDCLPCRRTGFSQVTAR